MNNNQIKSILSYYERTIQINKRLSRWNNYSKFIQYDHLLEMIPKMITLLDEGKIDKVNRWLGFIQGVLWMLNDFKLEDLKDHNRSEE